MGWPFTNHCGHVAEKVAGLSSISITIKGVDELNMQAVVLALALTLTMVSCGKSSDPNKTSGAGAEELGRIVEFQLYSGNESLPPPAQQILIIRGKINDDVALISYSYRDKDGRLERELKLEGDKFQRLLEIVRNTRIREKGKGAQPAGGAAFDVTLKDDRGRSVTGLPSNRKEWEQLAGQIKEEVNART